MRMTGGILFVFYILWNQYDPCRCLEDAETSTNGSTTSGQHDNVIVLKAAGSEKTFRVRLTNSKEVQLQDGSTILKIFAGNSDTVNGTVVEIPPGVYYLTKPGNTTRIGFKLYSEKTELSEAVNASLYDQNGTGNSTDQLSTEEEILNEWNIGDNSNLPFVPTEDDITWPIDLNVTNCTGYRYGNEVKVMCHDIVISETGPQLPANTTILEVAKCFGSEKLRTPALSHMTELRVLQLYNCHIRYIKTIFFQGLEKLRKLKLNRNDIWVFGKHIFNNTLHLTELDVSSNYIFTVRSLSDSVKDLRNLSKLFLDHNKVLERILSTDFENLRNTTIDTLTLSDCALSIVEEGAFLNLNNLKTLDLSINPLKREALHNITKSLVFSQIQHLDLQELTSLFQGEGFITKELQPLEKTQLVSLNLDTNFIVKLNEDDFPNLTTLRKLSMNNCFLYRIHPQAFDKLTQLEQLLLKRNRLISISFEIPTLKLIDFSSNSDLSVKNVQFEIPDGRLKSFPNLYVFRLVRSTYVGPITKNTFSGLYNLRTLYIVYTGLSNISDYAFQNLSDLRHLFLSSNSIKVLTGKTFTGLHKLTQLYIDGNLLSYFSDSDVFSPLLSLEVLSMRRNQLKHLPPNIFSFNGKLEFLSLGDNHIPAWNNEIFSTNMSLRVLLLSNNVIKDVSPTMLTTFKNLDVLDLSRNIFTCNSCNMKHFQDWILNPGNTTIQHLNDTQYTYMCSYPNSDNVSITDAIISETLCLPKVDHTVEIVAISVCTCAVLILGFTLSMYKLRWYVRYLVFIVRTRVKRYREFRTQEKYTFDAFVSYSSADVSWVAEELVPHLEGPECRFRLCLHDRDFMGGVPITDNILASIDSSRKTIMVLTEDFVKSNWCMFELHMAQHRLFEDTRDALVLVQLKNVHKAKQPRQLKYLLKTRTYIPWITSDQSLVGNRLFWKKLSEALKRIEPQQTLSRII